MRSKIRSWWISRCEMILTWLTTRWLATPRSRILRKPDVVIGREGDPYLKRWHVIPRNRIFNIYLHKIVRSDDDRALHDHPWINLSIILHGRYFEVVTPGVPGRLPDLAYERTQGDIVFRRAVKAHRLVVHQPCWSLFITGPKIREWGFLCERGWVHWRQFTKPGRPGEIGRGCDV